MQNRLTATILVALVACSALAQDAVTFRRTFTKDAVERYAMSTDMEMTMTMMGETSKSTTKLTNDLIIRVLEVKEDGSAEVEIKTENTKSESEADGQKIEEEEEEHVETSGKGNLNPLMVLTNWKPTTESQAGEGMFGGIAESMEHAFNLMQFPDKPVKPGDEWKVPMPSMDMFAQGQMIEGKFVGAQPLGDGKSAYVLTFSGDMKLDIDLSKMMGEVEDKEALEALGEIKVDGTMEFHTRLYLDMKTFQILKSTSNATTKTKMKSPLFDMGMDTVVKSEMKLK